MTLDFNLQVNSLLSPDHISLFLSPPKSAYDHVGHEEHQLPTCDQIKMTTTPLVSQ